MSSNSIYTSIKEHIDGLSKKPQPWLDFEPIKTNYQAEPLSLDGATYNNWNFPKGELNPNYNGTLVKQAWVNGAYADRDQSTASKLGWQHRDRQAQAIKFKNDFSQWKEKNYEYWLSEQRRKLNLGREIRKNNLQKLEYCDIIYHGWAELSRATGKSKYLLQKDPSVKKL